MVQTSSQSTVNKIEMRLRGKGRGSIVFQQDYADCGTPSAVKSTFHRMYTDGMLMRLGLISAGSWHLLLPQRGQGIWTWHYLSVC